MKRNNLQLLFTLLSSVFSSQVNYSWFPVRPGTQYNYRIDSSSAAISNSIRIDSVSPALAYHLNKIVTNCDTCKNASLLNDPNDSTYVLNRQPQFLKHRFVRLANNSFYFTGPSSMLLRPYVIPGSSWLFDTLQGISATLLFKNVQQVLGFNDSVCGILLSSNDTILLSRSFGILQFPCKTTAPHRYRLVGTEGIINAGIKLKRFHDFFNFNAGDVLQYSFSDTDYNIFPPKFQNGRERWDIQLISVYPDSVCCNIKRTYFDSVKYGNGSPGITSYTANTTISFIDSTTHMANGYPLGEIFVTPYFIYNNGIRYIHRVMVATASNTRATKSFGENCPNLFLTNGMTGAAMITGFSQVYQNKSNRIVGRKLTEGLGFTSELYRDFDRIYERCLTGYIKGADTSGIIYTDPVGIKTNTSRDLYSVYTDQADHLIIIEGKLAAGTKFILLNSLGQVMTEQQQAFPGSRHLLNTSSLPAGVYFIMIAGKNVTSVNKLLVNNR